MLLLYLNSTTTFCLSDNHECFDIVVQITDIKMLELKLKFGSGLHGRIHITEVTFLCFWLDLN